MLGVVLQQIHLAVRDEEGDSSLRAAAVGHVFHKELHLMGERRGREREREGEREGEKEERGERKRGREGERGREREGERGREREGERGREGVSVYVLASLIPRPSMC